MKTNTDMKIMSVAFPEMNLEPTPWFAYIKSYSKSYDPSDFKKDHKLFISRVNG